MNYCNRCDMPNRFGTNTILCDKCVAQLPVGWLDNEIDQLPEPSPTERKCKRCGKLTVELSAVCPDCVDHVPWLADMGEECPHCAETKLALGEAYATITELKAKHASSQEYWRKRVKNQKQKVAKLEKQLEVRSDG